jgi:uncharacterized protein YqjF (DUF2071 family)
VTYAVSAYNRYLSYRDDIRAARRQRATLAIRHHRPFPLPERTAWMMGQTWYDLLFAHWPVNPAVLRPAVHPSVPIDTWEGSAYIGVTPFGIRGLHARGTPPVPGSASFPELNVRTYATIDGRPGIWFLSLDAANWPAVFAARRAYRLPYFRSRIRMQAGGDRLWYLCERVYGPPAAFEGTYAPTGPARAAEPGSLEYWLTERYCLYTVDGDGRVLQADIHHAPWPVAPAAGTIAYNTMLDHYGIDLPGAPLMHFARRQDVLIWPLRPAP